MAQPTEPNGSSDFPGDEFANNLFSDLAPLLTLFGEQVTKQFLSMSMGWADNVLLAMGPLGILTVVVSAIRVGGVRQLKALVGRARESLSTAEQELLSSTSPDVCELWSGKEIVRMIGSPAGMKNLIIATTDQGKLEVLDLRTAVVREVLYFPNRHLDTLMELRDAAPNLTLNVENATAPTWQLWLWALLGVALQLAAMVLPGVATYYWKWEKAGNPTAPYGYPCFLIGTSLVIIGVMFCGHVIEGITVEHHFEPVSSTKGLGGMKQVVRLQRSCTVGDQHFPPFAIYNSPGKLTLRTSRLTQQNLSFLALIATVVTVAGFIVQFVGLRALHWSATIMQLGVTLLMTGVRAYVRRGLAGNPVSHELLEGHEAACLALHLLHHDFSKKEWALTRRLTLRWEVQTLHALYEEDATGRTRTRNLVDNKFPRLRFTGPLCFGESTASEGVDELAANAVELHESIHKLMPQHDRAVDIAERLAKAIERLTASFAKTPDLWWAKPDDNGPFRSTAYQWCIPVTARISPKAKETSAFWFYIEQSPSANPWALRQRSRLHSMLALWLCTLEEQTKTVGRLDLHSGHIDPINPFALIYSSEEQHSLRIVARGGSGASAAAVQACIERWLGKHVYSSHLQPALWRRPRGVGHRPWPVFGAFLSTFTLPETDGEDLLNFYIHASRQPDVALQCAQEILSLFILSVASKVKSVGGTTIHSESPVTAAVSDEQPESKPREWTNSVFQELAEGVVETGLAHDMTEAYTLVIPAFYRFGLLPTEPGTKPPFPRDISQTQNDEEIQQPHLPGMSTSMAPVDGE